MGEPWLEIADPEIDAQEVQGRVRERMQERQKALVGEDAPRHGDVPAAEGGLDPAGIAASLYRERFGRAWDDPVPDDIAALEQDCDIVPENYVIDWRVPILGPIHAVVRRLIHAEIRRYLLPMLQKQSHLNRRMLQALDALRRENEQLRRALERVEQGKE
jgi:O-antigen chain-terminating methyltransferase